MDEMSVDVSGVKIIEYEAETSEGQAELLRLTDEETNKPGFPDQVRIFKRQNDRLLTIIAAQPDLVKWTWPREFDPFRVEFTRIH